MKMKLIVTLLVLCIAFSTGSALAQSETYGRIDKPMIGSKDKMTSDMGQATIIVAGKVNGTITVDKMTNMTGMAGGMGSTGKNMTRMFSGDMVIVKDINNKTETTVMLGKMDGMTKRVVMIGKTQYGSEMSEDNETMTGMSDDNNNMTGMYDTSREKPGMTGMTGGIDNKIGAKDNEKVVITGNITCMTVGKIIVLGEPDDLKEMSSENASMNETSENMGNMAEETPENMSKMAGALDNKSVIASANVRCNMVGKMIIIGKLSDVKKEMMAGSEKESMQGVAIGKAGAARFSNDNMTGAVAGKSGAVGFRNEGRTAVAGYRARAAGVSNEDLTIIMTGITRCKITGINMVVIGKTGEMSGEENGMMTGTQSGEQSQTGMMTGTQEQSQTGMMTGTQSDAQSQKMDYGQSQNEMSNTSGSC